MNQINKLLLIGLVVASSFAGGAVTTWLVSSTATAQNQRADSETLRVGHLQVLDASGNVRIDLNVENDLSGSVEGARVFDEDGNEIKGVEPTVHMPGRARIQVFDGRGNLVWSMPQDTEFMLVR